MGRARITLKPISNERSRQITFKQRNNGLFKKIKEFSTMCGVDACLIVYDDMNGVGPMTYPVEPARVRSIIVNYERQRVEKPSKTFSIQDFFDNRKNMIEAEISKLHKQAREIKYPSWDPSLSNMGEDQLRAFIGIVNDKIGACDQRINMLKNINHDEANNNMQNMFMTPTPMNFTNGGASSLGISMQQGGYIPSMLQSQHSCLQINNSLSKQQLMTLKGNNEMLDFTDQVVDVPLNSINQLGESMDWANGLNGIEDWANPLNDDLVGWASQPDQSTMQQQQGVVPLPAFPPSLDGFEADYRNMLFRMANF